MSPREPLRRRYRAIVAANPELASRPWWPAAAAELEIALVEGLDLAETRSLVEALELMNPRQQAGLLAHHRAALEGEPLLEVEHLCEGGEIVFRVSDAANLDLVCIDVGAGWRRPDLKRRDVFAVADPRGLYTGLIVGAFGEPVGPSGRRFLVADAPGFLPVWEDRDPSWGGDLAQDPAGWRAKFAPPVLEWFAALRSRGVTVRWEGSQTWEIETIEDLVTFYDRFRWSPGRYHDGFDERFGIDGEPWRVRLKLEVADCLGWAAHHSLVWKIDPAVVAEGMFAAAVLSGESVNELLRTGTAGGVGASLKGGFPASAAYSNEERQAQVDRFLRRLDQLGSSLGESVRDGHLPDPADWPAVLE